MHCGLTPNRPQKRGVSGIVRSHPPAVNQTNPTPNHVLGRYRSVRALVNLPDIQCNRGGMRYHDENRAVSAPKLLDQVRAACRSRHYSRRTEQAYVAWVRRYILANGKRHPRRLGQAELVAFLTRLAVDGDVAASTQNQALSALLFLYRQVLDMAHLPWLEGVVRAKRPSRIPVVLSRDEVRRLLAHIDEACWLMAALLYGTGMRLMECVRLRVKDVDFDRNEICVRNGKGG